MDSSTGKSKAGVSFSHFPQCTLKNDPLGENSPTHQVLKGGRRLVRWRKCRGANAFRAHLWLLLPANCPRFLLALQESAGKGSCRGTEQRRLSRPAAVSGRCGGGASGGACKEGWHAHGRRQASAPDVHEVRSRHPAPYGTPTGTPKPHTGLTHFSVPGSPEMGVIKPKALLPFTVESVGTYSCHGVEPGIRQGETSAKINQDRGCVCFPFGSDSATKTMTLMCVFDGHGASPQPLCASCMTRASRRTVALRAVCTAGHPLPVSPPDPCVLWPCRRARRQGLPLRDERSPEEARGPPDARE